MSHDARRRLLRALPAALHALVVRRTDAGEGARDAGAPGAPGDPHATLVSWVTQASFEPPLVVVALRRDGTTLPLVERAGAFTLSPLDAADAGATALARRIGRPGAEAPEKDAGLPIVLTAAGTPALGRAVLGWLDCRVRAVHAAGDHALVVAAIVDAAIVDVGTSDANDVAAAGADGAAHPLAPLAAASLGWTYAG